MFRNLYKGMEKKYEKNKIGYRKIIIIEMKRGSQDKEKEKQKHTVGEGCASGVVQDKDGVH